MYEEVTWSANAIFPAVVLMDQNIFVVPVSADEREADGCRLWSNRSTVCIWRQGIAHVAVHAFHTFAVNLRKTWRCGTYAKARMYRAESHIRPCVPQLLERDVLHVIHSLSPSSISSYSRSFLPFPIVSLDINYAT